MLRLLASSLVFVSLVGCTGENAKDATAAVIGKGIEVSKGTVTGIAEGVAEGRKHGESKDGALIVSSADELALHGRARLGEVTATAGKTTIPILVENTADQPLRATSIVVIVLDKDGVVIPVDVADGELTVPPRAKARLEVTTAVAPGRVGVVRLYGKDLAR